MKVLAADLLRSAARAADFPRDPLPQIAFVGRSNVGKSSLINALVKRDVARTSAAPGKTRLINLYVIALAPGAPIERFYLVDLPGYGYARGGAPSQQAFEALTQEYFACPPAETGARGEPLGPTAVLQLVDIRHPGLPQDIAAGDIGRVELRGTSWSARNRGGELLTTGRRCVVVGVDQLMLIIEPEGARA